MPQDDNGTGSGAGTGNGRSHGRRIDRRTYLAGAGAVGLAAAAGCTGNGGGGTTINILTWEEFREMEENIEETLDVSINIEASASSSTMFQRWNQGADEEFDIAVPNNNLVPRFLESGLIAPVDTNAVTSYDGIYDKFQQFVDQQFTQDGDAYGVPIRWGWYGYSYDTRNVPEHDPSYRVMFEEDYIDADLSGNIVMYDEANKTMPVAALYLAEARDDPSYREALEGEEMTFSEEQINEMQDLLVEQKSRLQGYISKDPRFISGFTQGNFLVGHSGRNETIEMRTSGEDWVEFVVPQEGAMAWYETAVVSAASDNTETAWEVVNEFIAPENGAALARAGFSPSCNPDVAEELSEEQNELYGRISPERLEEFIPFKDIADDVERKYSNAWNNVKAA
ncbi:spermidine/putrescine ABC transporter substrate-binding protein [Halobacteriales archaeon QS_4_69_225]|nr:MAG: spermidine/putrescine ABC transporter substrate-binding protein [Halobacteriales archaeon QS_4_69_225]